MYSSTSRNCTSTDVITTAYLWTSSWDASHHILTFFFLNTYLNKLLSSPLHLGLPTGFWASIYPPFQTILLFTHPWLQHYLLYIYNLYNDTKNRSAYLAQKGRVNRELERNWIGRGLFEVCPEICLYGTKKPLLASVSTGSLGADSSTRDLPKT